MQLVGAAVAIAKALSEKETAKPLTSSSGAVRPGMTPSRVVDLQMKNFEQLRYLQQLYEEKQTKVQNKRTRFQPHLETLIYRCSGHMHKQFVKVDKFHSHGSNYSNLEVLPAEIPGVKGFLCQLYVLLLSQLISVIA